MAPFVELDNGDKDGVPTALLEAMAAGCAVVVTDAGSIAEVVTTDVDGIVVPQRSPEALADAMAALLDDAGTRARLGGAAVRRVRTAYGLEQDTRLYERIVTVAGARQR